MNDLFFIKILIVSACFAWVWVEKLTNNYGLFDWMPKYYPAFLNKMLTCSYCLGGWSSMILVFFLSESNYIGGFYTLAAPFCTMVLVGIINKITV